MLECQSKAELPTTQASAPNRKRTAGRMTVVPKPVERIEALPFGRTSPALLTLPVSTF